MPDADVLLRQIGAPFLYGILPPAPVALTATGVNAFDLMTVVSYGLIAGLVAAVVSSPVILRTTT